MARTSLKITTRDRASSSQREIWDAPLDWALVPAGVKEEDWDSDTRARVECLLDDVANRVRKVQENCAMAMDNTLIQNERDKRRYRLRRSGDYVSPLSTIRAGDYVWCKQSVAAVEGALDQKVKEFQKKS